MTRSIVPRLTALGLLLATAGLPAATVAAQDAPSDSADEQPDQPEAPGAVVAVLGALDKITGRVSELRVPIGGSGAFYALEIAVFACQEPPADERPESAAYLTIHESPPDEEVRQVFSGWMFASSPAVSAMDHAVYDVWVTDCVGPEGDSAPDG